MWAKRSIRLEVRHPPIIYYCNQAFRQFCKVAYIFPKALDVTFFAVCLASAEGELPRMLRNAVSSVSGNQESVSQARLEFTQILFKK